ncbi:unnamed protein product [Brassica rapa]|uniref:Uncharacterized protein n=2 Tax=Brassica TaxID=3705 RepID=A0A8D9G1A2_BRACM|nr:unnamed protein product [Brassica napus]CAG7865650.1 unnamed protein product [Brassica rapa]
MDKKKTVAPQSSSSSSSSSFDHIFGPRVSSPPSSSTTGLFNSIFPRPSEKRMLGRQMDFASRGGHVKYQSPSERGERSNKKDKKSYHNEETEPPCNLSSSIYYGGQENYSSTTTTTKDTYKKDGDEGDSKSASRGNWWEGIVSFLSISKIYIIFFFLVIDLYNNY